MSMRGLLILLSFHLVQGYIAGVLKTLVNLKSKCLQFSVMSQTYRRLTELPNSGD